MVINGTTYDYPETDDVEWGPEATDWAAAVTSGMLQKAGGLFQLLAEVDFGTTYGLKSTYYKTRTSNIADAGQFRLARADVISWRNQANNANLDLGVSTSNVLQFAGVDLLPTTLNSAQIWVGNGSNIATAVTMSGDATLSNAGVITVAANAITNAKLAQMATLTIKGNNTGGTANALDLTATQVTAMLNAFVGDSGSGGTKGLVPAPAAGDAAASKFLKADGTWTSPAGAGDVVGPASSTDSGFARFDGTTGKLLKNSAATIVNADVSASAAIAYSKLSLTGSIVNADVNASAAIAYSKLNLGLAIVNSDISNSAAIAFSKLSALPSAEILVGNASNVAAAVAVTGDISLSNAGVVAISAGAIVNADVNASAAIALNKLAATTASRALVSDGDGFVSAATTTATEIGYVNGVTSAIQTQLNAIATRPGFQANNASATVTSSMSNVVYGTEESDPSGMYNNTTGVATVPSGGAGVWLITASLQVAANFASGDLARLELFLNGSTVIRGTGFRAWGSVNSSDALVISTTYVLAVGNTVQVRVLATGATPSVGTSFTGVNYFTMQKLSN